MRLEVNVTVHITVPDDTDLDNAYTHAIVSLLSPDGKELGCSQDVDDDDIIILTANDESHYVPVYLRPRP